MRQTLDCGEIIPWLVKTAADFSREVFDGMPPVTFRCAKQKDCRGIEARYICGERVIEFSPGFIASCWKKKRRFWDLGKLWGTLLHELVHAWVDWKGLGSEFAEGHNEWFLWKAHCLRINLAPTRARYGPALIELHEEIKRGWNPTFMSLGEWRGFANALEGWDRKDWETLLSDCRVIERIEKRMPADAWHRVVEDVNRWNPFVSDYELVKNIDTYVPADLLYWVVVALGGWHIPAYELVNDLRGRSPHSLGEYVGKWRDAIWAIEQWERAPARTILNELESLHADEQGEIARIVSRCEPLRKVLARVKEQFYREIDEVNRNAAHLGIGCSEDWDDIYLYAEANYSFVPKLTTDTIMFEDFCKLCAV